ncbi:MAG: dinuclear metal center YbgI/SA1388 family protein [Planctomycetota bacterium]|jgi:dinuclear metal center YbgI/SA1388 family protein
MKRDDLTSYLDSYLDIPSFKDYCPNGLQVEGSEEVRKIALGVTSSVELIRQAIAIGADTILVHHGIIWRGVQPTYRGGYKQRVKLLLEGDINLYGIHLPLDAHPEVGNNATLARQLGLREVEPFGTSEGKCIGVEGRVPGITIAELEGRLRTQLGRDPLVMGSGPEKIQRIGIITGGAQGELSQAIAAGLDVYITGEASEMNYHQAQEEGIHFIAAGHHATERGGVQSLGQHLQERFNVQTEFIEIPNPI